MISAQTRFLSFISSSIIFSIYTSLKGLDLVQTGLSTAQLELFQLEYNLYLKMMFSGYRNRIIDLNEIEPLLFCWCRIAFNEFFS